MCSVSQPGTALSSSEDAFLPFSCFHHSLFNTYLEVPSLWTSVVDKADLNLVAKVRTGAHFTAAVWNDMLRIQPSVEQHPRVLSSEGSLREPAAALTKRQQKPETDFDCYLVCTGASNNSRDAATDGVCKFEVHCLV